MYYQSLMSTWERYYVIVQYNASHNYLCQTACLELLICIRTSKYATTRDIEKPLDKRFPPE